MGTGFRKDHAPEKKQSMSDKILKIVPAPEIKSEAAPEAKSRPEQGATTSAPAKSAPGGRKRLRMMLLVVLPRSPLLGGAGFYLMGGRYISTDNAYVGAQKVLITPDVSGKIIHVAVIEGQHVKPGDELFTLDPEPYRLALRQAKAKLDAARTDYDKLKATLRLAHQAGRSRPEERRAQAARCRAQEPVGQVARRLAGRRRHRRRRAGDLAIAGAIRQAAAHDHAQPVARQSRSAARRIPRICPGQGRARRRQAQSRPHRRARADVGHRHPGRQYPARPLRCRRHADPERDRRPEPLGRRQSEGNRHHLSARRAEGDARGRLVSPTTPSRAM